MKKTAIIATLVLSMAAVIIGCNGKRDTGRTYMPDMAYSRAYESYAYRDSAIFTMDPANAGHKIFFNNLPPEGTIKRGELFPFTVAFDATTPSIDSNATLKAQLAAISNPLPAANASQLAEAGRLFNINCAVCHGAKGEANGPIAGTVGGVKSIIGASPGFSDGRLFYIMTYGQGNMGSYAPQLTREQRWRIVQYIRTLEPGAAKTAAASDTAKATMKVDSAGVKK